MAWDLPQDTDNNASVPIARAYPESPQQAAPSEQLEYPRALESPSATGGMGGMVKSAAKTGANYITHQMMTPDYWKGMAAGAASLPLGAMQTIAHTIEGLVPPSPGVHPASGGIEKGINMLNQPGNEQYESGRAVGPYAGGAAATLLAPYLIPELGAIGGAGVGGAALRGALGGAALGASTPVTNNPSEDFAQKKFEQILPAAAAGGATSGLFGMFGPKGMSATSQQALPKDIATAQQLRGLYQDFNTAPQYLKDQVASLESGAAQGAPTGILSRIGQSVKSPWFKDWAIGLPTGELISQALLGHAPIWSGGNLGAKAGLAAGTYGLMQLMRSRAGQALSPYLSGAASQGAAQGMTDNYYGY